MYQLRVEKMSCGGCAGRVTRAVLSVDANAKVDIDLKDKLVRIETDAELERVQSAISGAGYPASADAA